jgi:hypothetical protein
LAADVARDDACRTTPPSSRTRRPEVGAEDGRQEEEAEAGGEKQRAVHVVNTSRFSERYYRKEKLLKKKVHGFCLSDVEGQHKYSYMSIPCPRLAVEMMPSGMYRIIPLLLCGTVCATSTLLTGR